MQNSAVIYLFFFNGQWGTVLRILELGTGFVVKQNKHKKLISYAYLINTAIETEGRLKNNIYRTQISFTGKVEMKSVYFMMYKLENVNQI